MSPLFGSQRRTRSYRIWVKYNAESPGRILYTGPWNSKAQMIWTANNDAYIRRIRTVITDQDIIDFLHVHPDMPLLNEYLDEWYTLEGSVSDHPNRLVDRELLADLRAKNRVAGHEDPPTPDRVRYFVDDTGCVYRWKDGRLTYVQQAGWDRLESIYTSLDVYFENEGDDKNVTELRIREVPDWAL